MRRSLVRAVRRPNKTLFTKRWLSNSKPEAPSSVPKPDKQASIRTRFDRFVERTPRFLRPTVTGLRQAPFSHVAAFFILHELTAVIPLVGLTGAFHYWHWLPTYFADGAWISAGVEKFGRYFRKKGWITEEEEIELEDETRQGNAGAEGTTRWVVEIATAYALVKLFLPVRIFVSVWGAPWFAHIAVLPVRNATTSIIRWFRRT